MQKIIIALLLLIPFAYAELQITPSGYDGTVYATLEKKAEISLKNTFEFPIHNITFSGIEYTTIPKIDRINPNETIKINISVVTDDAFTKKTFNSVVKFWYYSQINVDPKTHRVNITDTQFVPDEITITIGDSIEFYNNGSVFASIKDDFSPYRYFDINIPTGESSTVAFNAPDQIYYTDWNIFKKGLIIVENKSEELINNADYNKIFVLSLISNYIDSKIEIEVFPDNNISMQYNEFQELSIRVENTGNETIHNLTLSVDDKRGWFSFEDNNFDLTSNQNRYIDLIITPDINKSEETNKTYEINIIAQAENADQASGLLKIFIPFAREIYRITQGEDFWAAKARYWDTFCEEHPNVIECNAPPKIEKVIVKEYLNSTIELTKEEAMKILRDINTRLSSMEDGNEKDTKSINTMTDTVTAMNTRLDNLSKGVNAANEVASDAKERSDDITFNLMLFVFLIIVVGISGYSLYYFTWKKKRLINDG